MAHKKGQGSVKNGRDSVSKRLGVKVFGSQTVVAGNIGLLWGLRKLTIDLGLI